MSEEDLTSLGSNNSALLDNFHRISNVLPKEQSVKPITSDTRVIDALNIMKRNNYSQLAVSYEGEIIGVFSYRSFSLKLLKTKPLPTSIDDLIVENFIEQLTYHSKHDGFNEVIGILDKDDAILLGSNDNLQGIISSIDILNYLYGFTKSFIMISEIELTLRELIFCVIKPNELNEVIKRYANNLNNENPPDSLDKLTFAHYVSIISNGDIWDRFKMIFSDDRKRVYSRLKRINEIRNIVFHFKHKLTEEESYDLCEHRDWLLIKTKKMKHITNQHNH